jgi:hypothetical protein
LNASITEVNNEINQTKDLPVAAANKSGNLWEELAKKHRVGNNPVPPLTFETDKPIIPPTDSPVYTGDKQVVEIDSTDVISEGVSRPVVQIPLKLPTKQGEKVLVQ